MAKKEKRWVWFKNLSVGTIFNGVIHINTYLRHTKVKGRFIVTQTRAQSNYRWYIFRSSDRKRYRTVQGSGDHLALEGEIVGQAVRLSRSFPVLLDAKTGVIHAGCQRFDAADIMKKIAGAMGKTIISHP